MQGTSPEEPPRVEREFETLDEIVDRRGPFTAREALAAALPVVGRIDTEFELTFVGCGEDLDQDGGAYTWDLFFDFPRRHAQATVAILLCPSDADDDPERWCVRARVRPERLTVEERPVKLFRRLGTDLARSPREKRKQASLPLDFMDSPDAVRALAAEGVDWETGDRHKSLASLVLDNGETFWHTFSWNREYRVPFGRSGQDKAGGDR